MNINDLTLGQIKEIQALTGNTASESAFVVGEKYFIRTATYHNLGRLIAITPNELILEDASWIADSGRFHDALATGNLNEVEPYINQVIVSRGGIIDATIWGHELPRNQK